MIKICCITVRFDQIFQCIIKHLQTLHNRRHRTDGLAQECIISIANTGDIAVMHKANKSLYFWNACHLVESCQSAVILHDHHILSALAHDNGKQRHTHIHATLRLTEVGSTRVRVEQRAGNKKNISHLHAACKYSITRVIFIEYSLFLLIGCLVLASDPMPLLLQNEKLYAKFIRLLFNP